ncbi:MAG: class I SAM-dependent methyltransferase [Defluviitaleaceae bacterium]|nr:class I SAM-dependent methyltransferase [Defluviitaleaceae bacterium]
MNIYAKRSREKYDEAAHNYDNTADGKLTAKFRRKITEMLDVAGGEKVLDAGCGNGGLLGAISRNADISGFGVDISPKMIDECRARFPHIDFRVSEAENLPFDDGAFDVVIICCVLHHLAEPQKFFTEARRVLRPGGRLIVGEIWLPPLVKQIFECVVFPIHNAGDNKLFTRRALKKFFMQNGFRIIESHNRGFKQIFIGGRN